jgi:hypothetical protein
MWWRRLGGSEGIILDWVILNFECEDFLTAKTERKRKGSEGNYFALGYFEF